MAKPIKLLAVMAAVVLLAGACASKSGGSSSGGSGGGKTLIISTDLPMQGASKDASDATINAINLYLDQIGHKAGPYTIKLQTYDDSTAAAGKWDDATCASNAQAHVANKDEVAVMAPTTPVAPRSRSRCSSRRPAAACSWSRTPTPTPA